MISEFLPRFSNDIDNNNLALDPLASRSIFFYFFFFSDSLALATYRVKLILVIFCCIQLSFIRCVHALFLLFLLARHYNAMLIEISNLTKINNNNNSKKKRCETHLHTVCKQHHLSHSLHFEGLRVIGKIINEIVF